MLLLLVLNNLLPNFYIKTSFLTCNLYKSYGLKMLCCFVHTISLKPSMYLIFTAYLIIICILAAQSCGCSMGQLKPNS